MAGQSDKPSTSSSGKRSPFALLPLGKHVGKPAVPLTRPVIVIGSRESCRIHLNSSSVSQQHALLVLNNGTFYIHDLASRTHVIVNSKRVQDADLTDGDELTIGSFVLKFTGPASKRSVKTAPSGAVLVASDPNRPIPLAKRVLVIGRRSGSDVLLADASVSTMHAVIFEMDGQRVVRDLGSRTGTWVNGVQVHQQVLNAGDTIKIGPSSFTYQVAEEIADERVEEPVALDEVADITPARATEGLATEGLSADELALEALATETPPSATETPALATETPALATETPAASDDFGLDFLDPAVAETPVDSTDALPDDATDSATSGRRGWRAVVAEPIEIAPIPTPLPTPSDADVFDFADSSHATVSPDVAVDSEPPVDLSGSFKQDEAEAAERERAEQERIRAEQEQAEAARIEAARIQAAEIEAAEIEAARVEAARVEAERKAAEEVERQRVEAERLAAEQAERERLEAERAAAEQAAAERAKAERLAAEEAERQRIEAERVEAERIEAERVEAERVAAERAEAERIAFENAAAEVNERLAEEQRQAQRAAAAQNDNPDDNAETVAATDPSPESALAFDLESPDIAADHAPTFVSHDTASTEADDDLLDSEFHETRSSTAETGDDLFAVAMDEIAPDEISDSAFGRAVNELAGESGSIIELEPESELEPARELELTIEKGLAASEEIAPDIAPSVAENIVPAGFVDKSDSLDPLPLNDEPAAAESTFPGLEQNAVIAPSTEINSDIDLFDASDEPAALADFLNESSVDELKVDELEVVAPPDVTPAAHESIAPVEETPSVETPTTAPPASAPPASAPPSAEDQAAFWANTDTVLGGMPLALPPERVKPPFAEGPIVPPPALDEEGQIDAVSAMIGKLLDGAVPPPSVHEAIAPSSDSPSSRLAEPAGETKPAGDSEAAAPAARQPRRPLVRRQNEPEAGVIDQFHRLDEQIPPYEPPATRSLTDRGRREESLILNSLSHPPVTETDVFAHGSMPSSELAMPEELADDPFSPRGKSRVLPVTPMDLLGDVAQPGIAPGGGLRSRTLRRPDVGPGNGSGNTAIARVDLPADPFWSYSANGNKGMMPATAETLSLRAHNAELDLVNGNGGNGIEDDLDFSDPHSADEEIGEAGDESLSDIVERFDPLATRHSLTHHGKSKPQVNYGASISPNEIRRLRRRRFRKVSGLLLGGAALAVGAFVGCLKLIPVRSQLDMRLGYKHLAESESQRRQFVSGQSDLLHNDSTRLVALRSKLPANVPPGFLDDQLAYAHIADSLNWSALQPEQLTLSVDTTDPDGDTVRIKAVADALYDANGVLIDDVNRSRERLADATEEQANALRRADDLQKTIEQYRAIAEARPPVEKINQLTANADKMSRAWKDAEVALKAAQADVERLKAQLGNTTPSPADSSAPGVNGAPGANAAADSNTVQMQNDLAALQQKLAAAKTAHDQQAAQARADLDAALGQFQQQVAAAREMSRDNPQLSAYVAAAQKLQETTHQLVDDLINRQEQNYTRLTDLQARLGAKMQTRRQEMWQSDEKLKNLNDQLEYAKRQYNTALGTGDEKAAGELKAQIDLLESTIKARQDLLPDDPFYSDAVDALQKIVDQTKQQMKEDRQHSDEALDALQKSFASNQPAVDNLPAQQKTLTTELEKRLADINAARAKFNDLATDGSADDATRKLQDQIGQLTASIDARKKQLSDQSAVTLRSASDAKLKADLEAREADLPKLTQAVTDAKNASFAADAELQNAKHAVDQANAAMDLENTYIAQKISIKGQLDQLKADVQMRQDDVRMSIEPMRVADSDIKRQMGEDNRVLYGSVTSATILLIAGVLILMTIHAANQELPLNAMDPSDNGIDPFWQVAAAHAAAHPESTPAEPFPGANDSGANDSAAESSVAGEIVDAATSDSAPIDSAISESPEPESANAPTAIAETSI